MNMRYIPVEERRVKPDSPPMLNLVNYLGKWLHNFYLSPAQIEYLKKLQKSLASWNPYEVLK